MLAQTFFCVVSSIALITSEWWRTGKRTSDYKFEKSMKTISVVAVAAVFLQLALGALLRHTYSGLSVPDFPLIHGQLFPALSTEAIAKYNQELISEGIRWSGDKPIESYQIVIHMFHRYWAYIVSGIVLFFGFRLKSSTGLPKRLQRIGLYLIIFVILQFTLGIITVLSRKEFIITSLHVVIGALILMICVIATLQIARINWLHQESQL
jgi:heme A synthase